LSKLVEEHKPAGVVKSSSEISPSRHWLLPAAVAWSLLIMIAGVAAIGPADALRPLYGLADPRVGPAGFGAFAAHAILCGSDSRRKWVLRIGLLLEILRLALVLQLGVTFDSAILSTGYGFFAAALGDFLIRREWRRAALTALVPLGMTNAAFGLAGIVRRLTPLTYDGALFALDSALRIPFSRSIGIAFADFPPLAAVSLIAYAMLPGAIAAGLGYEQYSIEKRQARGVGVNLLLAYAVSGTIASLLYVLCPGTGPSHVFGDAFPRALPDASTLSWGLSPFAPLSPRNAMPSLHFAWAVMLWRSVKGARSWLRKSVAVFAFLTGLATIGSGEHYVVDLIAAVPFLVALEAATAHRFISFTRRAPPLAAGILFYGLWIVLARNGAAFVPVLDDNPIVMRALAIATLVIPSAVALKQIEMAKKINAGE
jgi:hypothetical protein